MKFISAIFILFLAPFLALAQFTIEGKINGYAGRSVALKKYDGYKTETLAEFATNSQGTFAQKILLPYEGILLMEFDDEQIFQLFSDNHDIQFTTDILKLKEAKFSKSKINQEVGQLTAHEKNGSKLEILSYLLELYSPKDAFYALVKNQMNELSSAGFDTSKISPVLKYNVDLEASLKEMKKNISAGKTQKAQQYRDLIAKRFKNDPIYLEGSDKFRLLLQAYIGMGNIIYSSSKENNKHLNKDIDGLLSDVGSDTPRAQKMLSGFLDLFKTYDMKEQLAYFIKKVESMTCEAFPELKGQIQTYKEVQPGKIAPDIDFKDAAYGKFEKLSQIKTPYKLLMFWASWCSHCQKELPLIDQRYEDLRKKGVVFIGLSMDKSKKAISNFFKENKVKWHNHFDGKGFYSSAALSYGITATPTFFLLDAENKILAIENQFDEILKSIK